MGRPSVSIITPSLNQGEYIEQTIDSVLSQIRSKDEYIIVDGGSDDGTIDIIKRYSKHLTYWVSEKDEGQSDGINKGLKIASGEVINWINSDDYLEPGAIRLISNVFRDPRVNVLAAKSKKFDEDSYFISSGTEVYPELFKTIGWARIDQPETWFRRKAFDVVGGLSSQLNYLMDREWWIRYLLTFGNGGIEQSDDIIVNFRHHERSKTISNPDQFEVDHDTIFFRLAEYMNLYNVSNFIASNFELRKTYNFPTGQYTFVDPSIMDFFLLRKAEMLYYTGHAKMSRATLKIMDKSRFGKEDLSLTKRIAFRASPFISSIIGGLRKWNMS